MTPLLWELVSVGELATPASVLIMVGTMALTAKVALKIHLSLEETFEHTFLGPEEDEGELLASATLSEPLVTEPEPVDPQPTLQTPASLPQAGSAFSGVEWQRSARHGRDSLRR